MEFKRENLYEAIKRQVNRSLKASSTGGRITEVILTASEWSKFRKEYMPRHGQASRTSCEVRFMVPDEKPARMDVERVCEFMHETHDVIIRCNEGVNSNEF